MSWKKVLIVGIVLSLLVALANWLLFRSPVLLSLSVALPLNCLVLLLAWRLVPACPTPPEQEEEEEDPPDIGFNPTLQIAHATLPYMRLGLNEATAAKTAEIIQNITQLPAVAITDRERVLAFLGAGCEYHHPGDRILTEATKEVIATGRYKVVHSTRGLNCPRYGHCDCPLAAAVIVPLMCREEVVGTLKLYQTKDGVLPPHVVHLAIGLAELLSMQMELAELDRQRQLLVEARLEALNAQINPHFFFNTLNTIISFSRTNPERARRLLIRLADLFRQTLKRQSSFTTLREELEFVRTYLTLEKARFGNKFRYIQDVPPDLLDYHLPVLSIQPLVENAINHGLIPKEGTGTVKVAARLVGRELILRVSDDGVGIPPERLTRVLEPGCGSGNGVGLSNVNLRFQSLYGQSYGLQLTSQPGGGTTVTLRVPVINLPQQMQSLNKEVAGS
ncbi:MAG: two-component system, LytTR family, sensor kinase [Clostridia bacterium]|nr:two-component system, LytTR family, sensor kinase [Clostridia bacterium]